MLKFSSGWYLCIWKSPYHMHSTPLLKGFSGVPFETVPPFLWLTMALLYRWRELPQVSFLTCLSWQNMSFVTTKVCLSRQKYLSQHTFAASKDVLSWQTRVCHDKSMLVMTKLVTAKLCLSRQIFVMTTVLSQQTKVLSQQAIKDVFCCDKDMFVTTNIILVAAPANDTSQPFQRLVSVSFYASLLQVCWEQLHNPLLAVVSLRTLCCPFYASLLQVCWEQLHNPLLAVVSFRTLCCPFYASLLQVCWEQLHNPLLTLVSLRTLCCPLCAVQGYMVYLPSPKKDLCRAENIWENKTLAIFQKCYQTICYILVPNVM